MSRGLIRPEAQPTSWSRLNDSQKKAVTQILETITDAVEQLPKENAVNRQNIEDQQAPHLSSSRASRIAFLDGQRGTGKSTILVTLLDMLKTGKIDGLPNKITNNTMEVIKNRVVLLEPIDMEPVPQHWNMLPAILARIEEAFSRYTTTEINDDTSSGLLDPANHYHDALQKLKQLQNNIALSWDGNLNDRAAGLNPDVYAQETMRNEQARIHLNRNVKITLDALARQISQCSQNKDPIFLLPIDDFDLNPRACLEVLRIIRMISVPRLFTLLLGDLEVVDVVLNLKQSADLNAVYANTNQTMLSVIPEEVTMLAGRISAHALHKLLPTMQCIELRPLVKYETLNYKPLGNNDENPLYKNLEKCSIDVGKHVGVDNLYGLLLTQGYFILSEQKADKFRVCSPSEKKGETLFCRSDVNKAVYSGLSLLNTSPRSAADLWIAFKRYSILGEEYDKGVNLIAQLCRNQLLRDSALTPTARRLTRGGFFNHPLGEWDLEALPLVTRSVIDDGRIIQISDVNLGKNRDEKCSLLACKFFEWRFRLKQTHQHTNEKEQKQKISNINKDEISINQQDSFHEQNKIEYMQPGKHYLSVDHLSTDTTGALILFHDLLSLGPNYRFSSFLLPYDITPMEDSWCKTVWRQGLVSSVELPWYAPLCRSFLGLDLFLSAWNRMLDESTSNITPEKMAFVWISAGTAAITSRMPITIKTATPDKGDWEKLGKDLVSIIKKRKKQHQILEKQIQTWLISVAVMIMPESGLPDISAMYKDNEKLLEYWYEYRRSIRIQRLYRLKKIYDADMKSLACKFHEDHIDGLKNKPIGIKRKILEKELQPHEFWKCCNRRIDNVKVKKEKRDRKNRLSCSQ